MDEHLMKLHWLKIRERIEFKILLLVYKSLNGLAPGYLSDLIKYNNISGSRTPSLLSSGLTSVMGKRAFVSYAPKLWNELPNEIKFSENVTVFKKFNLFKLLKTFLFIKSYNL